MRALTPAAAKMAVKAYIGKRCRAPMFMPEAMAMARYTTRGMRT